MIAVSRVDPLAVLEAVVELIEAEGPDVQVQVLEHLTHRYELGRPRTPRVAWSQIERLLAEHGPLSPSEVASRLPYRSRRGAQNAMYELLARRRLIRVGHGRYDVPRGEKEE